MPDTQPRRAPVQRLPPEDAAVGAVALFADLCHDLVHGPAVELVVADDGEGEGVLQSVAFDAFEAVVAVAFDAFVDGEQDEVEAVVVALVEGLEDRGEDGGVFAAGGADGDALAAVEEGVGGDGVVDLGFEDGEEAGLA